MAWLVSVLGGAIMVAVLWDVFHTLWHPSGRGRISRAVMVAAWRVARRLGRRARRLSGPLAMVGVITSWAALVVLGGALVYWPHLPGAFTYSPGLTPGEGAGFIDAVYVSLVTVSTLGFGDIVPSVSWLKLVTPAQALIGFALLTAAVSWVLQVYPALTRRRALSLQLSTYREAGALQALDQISAATAGRILDNLAAGLTQVRVDLTQYAESYYYQDTDPRATLALTIRYANDLAEAGRRSAKAEVRLTAAALECAIEDLSDLLDDQFLHTGGNTRAVLDAYAADQANPSR